MGTVHSDARMQLITGDPAPMEIDDLLVYNLFQSGRGFIVCREQPLFPTTQSCTSPALQKAVQLADPAANFSGELVVDRDRWERWLVAPGIPWGTIGGRKKGILLNRSALAAVWCRILPMGTLGPRLRVIYANGGKALGVQDRPGLAAALFPGMQVDLSNDPVPELLE